MAFPKGATALTQAANKTIADIKKQDLLDKEYVPEAA